MSIMSNMTIKSKLIAILMLTSVAALLLAATAFLILEWTSVRQAMVRNLSIQAEMIADNCKAALAFEDVKDAEKTLQVLRAEPSIVFGCVRTNDGKVFASYHRDTTGSRLDQMDFGADLSGLQADGHSFAGGLLTVSQRIVLDKEAIGTVYLRSDLHPMYAVLKRNTQIIAAVLLLCSLAALLVSSWLQGVISRPILSLAEVAKVVSEKKDYSTRAAKQSNDEVGLLIDAFNQMLDQIQQRDLALVNTKGQLEIRVRERTVELTAANEQLIREVAERRRAEEKLKEQKVFLANIIQSLTHPFYVIDANDHTIKMANSASGLGEFSEDLTCYALTHKRDRPCTGEHLCPLEEVKRTKKSVVTEHIHYDKDGNPRSFEVHGYPIFDEEGNVVQMIEYCLDITERKKTEQALERLNKDLESTVQDLSRSNKELKDFAHIIAHDLKAPLRAVGTLTDWISTDYRDKFDQRGKERIKLLKGRVMRMNELIDSVLRYSEIGRVTHDRRKVNLNTLITEIVDQIGPPENIEIIIENELPTVMCEKVRLIQIFQNLLSNAMRYMDKPQGRIRIGCVEEDSFWKFSVSDNGPGIEEQYFEKIFGMFQTLLPRDEFESTGIGLTEAKKIIETYGGRIWVESKVGEGTTFFFTLPKQQMGVKNAKLQGNSAISA